MRKLVPVIPERLATLPERAPGQWSQSAVTLREMAGRGFLAATRWRVVGTPPAPEDTCIFIGAPHTSSFDTVLMLATAWRCRLRVKFLIKKEFIETPVGGLLLRVGAIPVDRENPGPLIARLTEAAQNDSGFQLVLAPEGTRKPVEYWKSGFYRLSWSTGLPLALVTPDGPTRTIYFGPIFRVTGDVNADMDRIREFYADKYGVNPENRSTPRLRAESDADSRADLLAKQSY